MIAAAIAMLIGLGVAVAQYAYWSGRVEQATKSRDDWADLALGMDEELQKERAAHLAEIRNVKADLEWSRIIHATHIAPEMKPVILREHRAKVLPIRGGAR